MVVLLVCILLGILLGWKRWLPRLIQVHSGKIITFSIMLLLITMGLKIGLDKNTLLNLGKYGLQALIFAIMTIALSILMVMLFERLWMKKRQTNQSEIVIDGELQVDTEGQAHPYKMTVIIIGAFFIGIWIGFTLLPEWVYEYLGSLTNAALYFTLFAVGIDLGLNRAMWKQFMQIGSFVFLAPLGVAIGSILAGMIAGKLLGFTIWEGGAVASGFGWYSLSGVIITEIHSVRLGTIAFLSNVIREILAILLIPFLAKKNGRMVLVAPGGATTMDTTLPVIAAVGPPGIAIIAFVNGVVLSTLVPILVPLLLRQ